MRYIQILYMLFFMFVCVQFTSCTTQRISKDELVGTYIGKVSVYPHPYTTNIAIDSVTGLQYSVQDFNMDRYIEGDSGNYACTYLIYKRFIPNSLTLNRDGTFVCSYNNYLCGGGCDSNGHWDISAIDHSLVLSFNQLSKDPMYDYSRLLSQCPYSYEGERIVKIINKNKLMFECPVFNGPKNYKEITEFKRQK